MRPALAEVKQQDADLVVRARQGDDQAFTLLFRRHASYVAGVVYRPLLVPGILVFSSIVLLEILNLPGELLAGARARAALRDAELVDDRDQPAVRQVLSAAALTHLAATLQTALTLVWYVLRFVARR